MSPWVVLLYFIFGAAGTAARVALSTTISFGVNARTIVEVISGGVAGYVLPYFGSYFAGLVGLPAESVANIPPIIKAGIIFLVTSTGSLSVGEVLARFRPTPPGGFPPPR